jgi:hypothetical protein
MDGMNIDEPTVALNGRTVYCLTDVFNHQQKTLKVIHLLKICVDRDEWDMRLEKKGYIDPGLIDSRLRT